jgi:hypothetical protein
MAEMQRQQSAMMQTFTQQVIDFWSGALVVPPAKAGAVASPTHGKRRR